MSRYKIVRKRRPREEVSVAVLRDERRFYHLPATAGVWIRKPRPPIVRALSSTT